ncbi:MAG: MFS transporter [Cyanobacteriota bacterium]|nr:MFS transporter [Cyanobacteriota bacterium]
MAALSLWWVGFPRGLRLTALVRGWAAVGAGGILFLGPLAFHHAGLDSLQIGLALGMSSALGLLARGLSGWWLDRGVAPPLPMALAALLSMLADLLLLLLLPLGLPVVLLGEGLIGLAMGLYWPAAELAAARGSLPLATARGFALVRTADAIGIAAGAALGAGLATLAGGAGLRWIYAVDLLMMLTVLGLLPQLQAAGVAPAAAAPLRPARDWWRPLLPLLLLSLLGTGIITLQQSALPLDMVRGGLLRPALAAAAGGGVLALQLGLLVLLQWPVGRWLARRPVRHGLRLALIAFAAGCALLALSTLTERGLWLLLPAMPLLALASAAFLPTITEAVVETVAEDHRGLALGLYSQTWAVSGLLFPPLAGWALRVMGHGLGLWSGLALLALVALVLVPCRRRDLTTAER